MLDENIKNLERAWKLSNSYTDYYPYRVALIRAGRGEEAGLEIGDILRIEEVETPWIKQPWEGELLRKFEENDLQVRPVEYEQDYRVKPSKDYHDKGLYLTREDKRVVVTPVTIDRYKALAPTRAEHARLDIELAKERAKRAEENAANEAADRAPSQDGA